MVITRYLSIIAGLALLLLEKVDVQEFQIPQTDTWEERVAPVREHDFGILRPNEERVCKFVIQNPDRFPLEIHSAYTSCGCVSIKLDSKAIEVGNKTNLEVRWKSDKFRGKKSATVTLRFQKPIAEIQFVVTSTTIDYEVVPEKILLKSSKKESSIEVEVSKPDPMWELSRVQSSAEIIKTEILSVKRTADKTTYRIHIRLDQFGSKTNCYELFFISKSDRHSMLTLPIFVEEPSTALFSPAHLRLDSKAKKVVLKTTETSEIQRLSYDSEFIEVVRKSKGLKRLHIFSIQAATIENDFNTSLEVQFADGDTATLKITILGDSNHE